MPIKQFSNDEAKGFIREVVAKHTTLDSRMTIPSKDGVVEMGDEPSEDYKRLEELSKKLEEFHVDFPPNFHININTWLNETSAVKCYALYEDDDVKTMALFISPYSQYRPKESWFYMLSFIYTFVPYRRQNNACRLLQHIKDLEKIKVYAMGAELNGLLKKAGYTFIHDDGNITLYESQPEPQVRYCVCEH